MSATDQRYGLLAPYLSDIILNFFLRGVSPPALGSELYLTLGTSTTLYKAWDATEIAGMVRVPVPRQRGAVCGTNQDNWPYESSVAYPNSLSIAAIRHRCHIRVPAGVSDFAAGATGNTLFAMWYDAASGGNLLAVVPLTNITLNAGDIIMLYEDDPSRPAGSRNIRSVLPRWRGYSGCLVHDWLFRGYPMEDRYGTSLFPNTYLSLGTGYSGYTAIPRSTSSWAAPVTITPNAGATLARKCVNSVAVAVVATAGNAYGSASLTMTNAPQSVDDLLFQVGVPAFGAGDTCNYAIGNLQVACG